MDNRIPKYVTKNRAAYLLGLSVQEIGRISQECGIGHLERAGQEEQIYFTYEELQKLCVLASQSMTLTH